jgi:hypothetical protein
MKINKLIKKLLKVESQYGNIEVKLPQVGRNLADEELLWNANITNVKAEIDEDSSFDNDFVVTIV